MAQYFPSFPEFFTAVTDHDPHDWQIELAQRVQCDGWPARIEVPTGLGKTATIPVAVYELARQVHHRLLRTAPQRIFHVVNRRTLVDSTYGFIDVLAQRVNDRAHPHITPVRDALQKLLGPRDDVPIATGSIHGDTPRDMAWLRATGCTIVTLTPHQYVSRLLMRGFAVTPSRRPIDAGLVGIDRLVLFDEPHLAVPAVQTILDAERLQARAIEPLGVPLGCTVLLGATLPSALVDVMDRDSVLRLDAASTPPQGSGRNAVSYADRLLHARRRVHLERIKSSSDTDFAKAMAARAVAAADDGHAVVVFANTVGLAQHVYHLLLRDAAVPPQLITSRFRPLDRREPDGRKGITVTTQCLEVGVDISFDALVSEAASWDALVQRLGRLNRNAKPTWADAYVIVARTGSVRAGSKAVYGEETVRAAVELLELAEHEQPDGIIASPAALATLRRRGDARLLDGVPPRTATLHSGLVPLMTHTRPTPSPDLPVEAFVAGPDRLLNREIDVAWRDRVDALDDASFGDVYAAETVSVPRSALARLLRGNADDRDGTPIADVADMVVDEAAQGFVPEPILETLRVWDGGAERWRAPRSLNDVLRADRVVLPSTIGGYQSALGWTGDSSQVDDLHVVAARISLAAAAETGRGRRRQLRLSLSKSVVDQVLSRGRDGRPLAALTAARADGTDAADSDQPPVIEPAEESPLRELRDLLADLAEADAASLDLVVDAIQHQLPRTLSRTFTAVSREAITDSQVRIDAILGSDAPGGSHARPGDPPAGASRVVLCTITFPERSRAGSVAVVTLASHLEQVGAWAGQDGRAAGLGEAVATALGTAGRWHDVGKACPSFQRYLFGCPSAEVTTSQVETPDGTLHPLLAKPLADVAEETRSSWATDREARTAAGLVAGFRHEAASVAAFRDGHTDALTEHLIGSHHGWYRPVIAPLPDIQLVGYAHADDFAALNDRFGPWGVAYLEATLRLADWRASAYPDGVGPEPPTHRASPTVEPTRWDELLDHRRDSASVAGAKAHPLDGLVTHPLTGWFASVGLLAAAVDAGDDAATLHWESSDAALPAPDLAPQIPVLTTRLPLHDVVSWAFDKKGWVEADALVTDVLGTRGMNLRRKNQKLAPAAGLRGVLLRSEVKASSRLLLGLLGDAATADARGQVELPIAPFANNSSYPDVALSFLERAMAIDDCLAALDNMNLGYTTTACDGGLDRPRAAAPLVNGLGAPGSERSVRTALAPLALYGMGRLGNTGAAALGVVRSAGRLLLQLPVPTEPATLAALTSMTISIRSPRSWSWSAIGGEWTYSASREYLSDRKDVDIVWSGRVVRRNEAN